MKAEKFVIPGLVAISILALFNGWIVDSTALCPGNISSLSLSSRSNEATQISDYSQPQNIIERPADDSSLSQSTAYHANDWQPSSMNLSLSEEWALIKINIPRLWQITKGDPTILVAVLDTGIDKGHEDLIGKVKAETNLTGSTTVLDIYGHGTHIAGLIAANSENSVGIAGVAPDIRLLNVKVADDSGRCQSSVLAEGIIWAVDNGAHVINISAEVGESSPQLEDAVNYAWSKGVLIVAAAGNGGNEIPVYPAFYEKCIAVTALRDNDKLAPLSNYGDWVDVAAPGFNIYSTLPDNNYGHKTGTSFATAYVSGLAALLFTIVADADGDGRLNHEVRTAIETGCQEIGTEKAGKGRIDAARSMLEVK